MSGLDLGKCLLMSESKHFLTFVAMLLLYGELDHRVFLCAVFCCWGAWLCLKDRS